MSDPTIQEQIDMANEIKNINSEKAGKIYNELIDAMNAILNKYTNDMNICINWVLSVRYGDNIYTHWSYVSYILWAKRCDLDILRLQEAVSNMDISE